jgi:hypothetical protein
MKQRRMREIRSDFAPVRLELGKVLARRPTYKSPIARLLFYLSLQLLWVLRRAIPSLRGPEVCFYPERPTVYYTVWPICQVLGIKRTADPSRADAVCLFVDSDYDDEADERARADLERALGDSSRPVINIGCLDVGKGTVGEAFEEVFGYPLNVDPTTHHGLVVEKSDANARHDGRLVRCPIPAADSNCAYQVFANSLGDDSLVHFMRIPIMGNSVPFVYRKALVPDERFKGEAGGAAPATIAETADCLSSDEVELILQMCRGLGADMAEADVLRDNDSQRIYVVDVNKTCYGPPKWIGFLDRYRAIIRLAGAFRREFLEAQWTLTRRPSGAV